MPEQGFGMENLPYGVASRDENPPSPAVRLGDHAIDLHGLRLQSVPAATFQHRSMNPFIALGPEGWSQAREEIAQAIREGCHERHATPLAEGAAVLGGRAASCARRSACVSGRVAG